MCLWDAFNIEIKESTRIARSFGKLLVGKNICDMGTLKSHNEGIITRNIHCYLC